KDACLRQCQAPWWFIQHHGGFRADALGALALGIRHGGYCLRCWWGLMGRLFVGRVMDVFWFAPGAGLGRAERVVSARGSGSRIAGAGFFVAGAWLLGQSL